MIGNTQDVYASLFDLKLSESDVPEHIHGCFERYVYHRIPPGGFVEALLCNDLRAALGRADSVNMHILQDIVGWMIYNLPHNCWGSEAAYIDWLSAKNG